MDFKKIKTQAKETIDGKLWDVWKPALIIGFISMIISVVATSIFGSESDLGQIVVSLFSLLLVPAEVGYISYMLKFVRKEDYSIDDLKQYYPQIGLLIVINILIYIFVLLGLICLIIPIIWVVPYITTAQTLYYENLKELKNEEI